MLVHPGPRPTAREKDQKQFERIRGQYPEGVGLIEKNRNILRARSSERRMLKDGTVVKTTFNDSELAHRQIRDIVDNPQILKLVEEGLDIKVALHGDIVVAISCEASGCQYKDCPRRR